MVRQDRRCALVFDSSSLFAELEWKMVYVGSAEDESKDQELDSVLVGPVSVGRNRFTFEVLTVLALFHHHPFFHSARHRITPRSTRKI